MKKLLPLAALALLTPLAHAPAVLAQASAAQAAGKTQPSPLAPSEIVAAAPKGDWVAIAASDLLVMDLTPGAKGKPRRVAIQLMPAPFSQGWIGNIRLLAKAHWWDGLSINRVQDNYVVQWGDANGEDKAKAKPLPAGLAVMPESEYTIRIDELPIEYFLGLCQRLNTRRSANGDLAINLGSDDRDIEDLERRCVGYDNYRVETTNFQGFPLAFGTLDAGAPAYLFGSGSPDYVWPIHCYGMVGVGRDLSPNTGSGAELYVVIGHAPRHLDRNIALVGRVVEGIEHLSSLPRGTGGLGFYETAEERTGIKAIRLASEMETDKPLPQYEYLSTESASFAKYADARANRRDAFFIRPAGGADICNIPVPVRRVK